MTKSKRRPTFKQVLRYIDSVRTADRRSLWDVLTALRGPDSGDLRLKVATSAVIRRTALPSLSALALSEVDYPGNVAIRAGVSLDISDHFVQHALYAFDALGLEWNGQNE